MINKFLKIGRMFRITEALWADSANANSGQCARGAPLLNGDGMVLREKEA